jgi:[protein-PII] uridylyltransferase
MPEHKQEASFCNQLFINFVKPWVLMIAALFHDNAQGYYGDRSFLNSNEAKQFCDQHGLDKEDSDLIVWLVKHHLMMHTLVKDSGVIDPNIILQFAKIIKSERYLTALYLLAVADMQGSQLNDVHIGANQLLETLYQNIRQALGGVHATTEQSTFLEQRKQAALAKLQFYGLSNQSHVAFWDHLDVSFFSRYSAEQVAWLTRHLWDKVNHEYPIVKAHLPFVGEGIEVVVYTRDRPKLFGLLCGYFVQQNLSILEAGVYTTHHGYALDVFYVAAADLNVSDSTDYRSLLSLIEKSLTELLMQPFALLSNTQEVAMGHRQCVLIKPQVELRPDEQAKYFLLSLSANDQAGLLYRVAQVLAKHNIQLRTARITTLGEKVEDVFVLEGDALAENSALQAEVEADLLKVLTVS